MTINSLELLTRILEKSNRDTDTRFKKYRYSDINTNQQFSITSTDTLQNLWLYAHFKIIYNLFSLYPVVYQQVAFDF